MHLFVQRICLYPFIVPHGKKCSGTSPPKIFPIQVEVAYKTLHEMYVFHAWLASLQPPAKAINSPSMGSVTGTS